MIGLTEIAVCDDEKVIREQIVHLIDKQGTGCRIWQFGTGEELLGGRKHFDIIFLDIQMEGRNGIETAREIRKYDERAVIVFVTVVKEYVFCSIFWAAFLNIEEKDASGGGMWLLSIPYFAYASTGCCLMNMKISGLLKSSLLFLECWRFLCCFFIKRLGL